MILGYAMCGSFCTIERSIAQMRHLLSKGYVIQPFMSENVYSTDTRFGKCNEIREAVEQICGRKIVHTISEAEPYGPAKPLEAMIVSPCTGNTLAKLAHGITDTAVCMAVKAHMRNDRPLIIALATNDALSASLQNISTMMSRKNVYFVPLSQDDPIKKPHSLVCDFEKTEETLISAMNGRRAPKIIY